MPTLSFRLIAPWAALSLALGAWLPLAAAAPANAPAAKAPFVWADADGTVHTSLRLTDVAEPFAGIYRALSTEGERGALSGAALATGLEGERAKWQARLQVARARLLSATLIWAQVQEQDQAQQSNPILRLTPAVQAQHQASQEARAVAKARYLAARKALLETLPAEARRAQIPMAWLQ